MLHRVSPASVPCQRRTRARAQQARKDLILTKTGEPRPARSGTGEPLLPSPSPQGLEGSDVGAGAGEVIATKLRDGT